MLHSVIEYLKGHAEAVIYALGYPGIALLMLLDSMNIPIPSEAVMPVGGFLAAKGQMNLHIAGLAGGIGSAIGSCISYWIGAKLGKPFLLKYGKFLFLREEEIEKSERWFEKYGLHSTLWGRFIPLVRTFISFPAGLYRAPFGIFAIYAVIGGVVWCYLWCYLGFKMMENWHIVEKNMQIIDIVVIGGGALLIGRFLYYRFRKNPPSKPAVAPVQEESA